ncbi:MAG: archaeosortase/exosortase family protein [Bacteroidales bacterium]|nr:archaeosortase/exosortase family protein [Bacteroidales bacterium]
MKSLNLSYQHVKTLYQRYRPVADVILFILITVLAHKFYWAFSTVFNDWGWMAGIRDFMRELLFNNSAFFLDKMYPVTHQGTTFLFPEVGFIEVNNSCSGVKQFYQIIVLFLLFPGPWKHKLWYIPMSMILMHGVNIFRIVILGVILQYWPEQWDFMHDWILRPFFYVVIFSLWVIWNEKIRKPGPVS